MQVFVKEMISIFFHHWPRYSNAVRVVVGGFTETALHPSQDAPRSQFLRVTSEPGNKAIFSCINWVSTHKFCAQAFHPIFAWWVVLLNTCISYKFSLLKKDKIPQEWHGLSRNQIWWTVIHFHPCNTALHLQTTASVLLYTIFLSSLLYIWWHLTIDITVTASIKSTKQARNIKVQNSIYIFERFYFILIYLKIPKYPR